MQVRAFAYDVMGQVHWTVIVESTLPGTGVSATTYQGSYEDKSASDADRAWQLACEVQCQLEEAAHGAF